MTKKPEPEKPAPQIVTAAYQGRAMQFKLYTDGTGATYVRLPSGKRAVAVLRRDGTYVVEE